MCMGLRRALLVVKGTRIIVKFTGERVVRYYKLLLKLFRFLNIYSQFSQH